MNNDKLISIVVPIFNVENYLKECIDSILNQTYKNIEVILVDDGSPDNCGVICDEYMNADSRIKVIHKKNGGLSDARNAGMKIATGEYITFVDSDDYISSDFLSVLYNAIIDNNADVSIANMKRTNKRDESDFNTELNAKVFDKDEALIHMLYGVPFSTSACGKLYKRSLFNGIEFPFGKFSEDLFTIYKVLLVCEVVVYVSFDGYFYYYREGSLVVNSYTTKHLEVLEAIDNIAIAVRGKKQFNNAIANQYINVLYDIATRKPCVSEFQDKRIQDVLKTYRFVVLKDKNAPKRLRAFSALSLLGSKITLKVIEARINRKWKL